MKKLLFQLQLLLAIFEASASTVAWDVVYVDYAYDAATYAVRVSIPDDRNGLTQDSWDLPRHFGNLFIGVRISNGTASLTSNPLDFFPLTTTPEAWLFANPGDIVDASTTSNQGNGHYFYNDLLGNTDPIPDSRGTPAELAIGEVGYFKLAVMDEEQFSRYVGIIYDGGQPDFTPTVYYGWASFTVDSQGNLTFLESAIGLDGQSMVVGAIPEPSAVALLLLGLATLALRRRAGFASQQAL